MGALEHDFDLSSSDSDESELPPPSHQANGRVSIGPPDYASNRAENWDPPKTCVTEQVALNHLKGEWTSNSYQSDWRETAGRKTIIVELTGFEIYRYPCTERFLYELTSLHLYSVKTNDLSFNGHLTLGPVTFYVERVDLACMSVGGYGSDSPTTAIYIQSDLAKSDRGFDIWYKLKTPARSYSRYFNPFLWISVLGKHVIDFLEFKSDADEDVTLSLFRNDFLTFLQSRYAQHPNFRAWLKACGRTDFRHDVHAYIYYLYEQAFNQPTTDNAIIHHSLWAECLRGDESIVKEYRPKVKKTIATPFVYEHFKNMYFSRMLSARQPTQQVLSRQNRRKRIMGFPDDAVLPSNTLPTANNRGARTSDGPLQIGDVVEVTADKETRWNTPGEGWFAYIQGIKPGKDGDHQLDVIWLYEPCDTVISGMTYLVKNELFFSDQCNCEESNSVLLSEVLRKCTVSWKPQSLDTSADFIIRQTYDVDEHTFTTLKECDFYCSHYSKSNSRNSLSPPPPPKYQKGDTVYVLPYKSMAAKGVTLLEPVVITHVEEGSNHIMVRRLLRLARDCSNLRSAARRAHSIPPNELVWTDDLVVIHVGRVQRKCKIRFFPLDEILSRKVPFPYNKNGEGDYWIISASLAENKDSVCLSYTKRAPGSFNQDLTSDHCSHPLKGMSIFSGGGNFDRGLEEAGAVQFHTAIDLFKAAIHTQRANAKDMNRLNLYCGSVDDYLKEVLCGNKETPFARVGDVEVLAGGTPCPGFSTLQPDFLSNQSLGNASHISTFCSYVDIYRPQYAFLENVVTMGAKRKGLEGEKVFCQVIGCLVAMGYQVSFAIMDSGAYGSSQSRSRIIISAVAPNLEPIRRPSQTHRYHQFRSRGIGETDAGSKYGCRQDCKTPFDHVSAGESTRDLPDIGTSSVQACIPFPDHRLVRNTNINDRALLKHIPKEPPGKGYAYALKQGLVPATLQRKQKKDPGKSFQRLVYSGSFPTITTTASLTDRYCGNIVHWKQDRPITIQEARRAQGVPDDEVLIGTLAEQYKIIGNAVDRHVAVAQGLALRESWEASQNYVRNISDSTGFKRRGEVVPDSDSESDLMDLTVEDDDDDDSEDELAMAVQNQIIRERLSARKRAREDTQDDDTTISTVSWSRTAHRRDLSSMDAPHTQEPVTQAYAASEKRNGHKSSSYQSSRKIDNDPGGGRKKSFLESYNATSFEIHDENAAILYDSSNDIPSQVQASSSNNDISDSNTTSTPPIISRKKIEDTSETSREVLSTESESDVVISKSSKGTKKNGTSQHYSVGRFRLLDQSLFEHQRKKARQSTSSTERTPQPARARFRNTTVAMMKAKRT